MPFTGDDHNLPAGSIIPNGTASDAVTQHNAPLNDISDALSTLAARVTGKRAILTATATPEEFGGTDAASVEAAIDYLGTLGGGTLLLGNDRYESPYTGEYFSDPTIMDTANITILGSGRPTFNSTFSTLEGGTIIEGSFFFAADGFIIANLGLDCGSDYCTANNAGVPIEGLIGIDRDHANVTGFVGADATKYGAIIKDVSVLSHKTGKAGDDSDVHAFLLENYKGWIVDGLWTVKGGAGQVIKSSHGHMRGSWIRGSYKYGVLNKSESYADASFNNYSGIIAENLGTVDPDITVSTDYDQGPAFRIEAATADARHISAANVTGNGTTNGIEFYALAGYTVDNCHVIGGSFRKTDGYPCLMYVSSTGTVENSTISNVQSDQSTSGFYMNAGTSKCAFINCHARTVTLYSFGNAGTGNRYVSPMSDTPAAGHFYTSAGDVTVVGGYKTSGSAGLSTVASGTISGLTDAGMFISEGTNYITNGDCESIVGYDDVAGSTTLTIVAGGQVGNCLQVARTGAPAGYVRQQLAVTAGQRVTLNLYYKNGTTSSRLFVSKTSFADGYYTGGTFVALSNAAWTLYTLEFTPETAIVFVTLQCPGAAGTTFLIDEVSLKAIPLTVSGDADFSGDITSAGRAVPTYLTGTATYDPASLADGVGATTTVTVTGAALGDIATASFSLDLQGITLTAWVSSANTVSVRFQNETGGPLDLASGTIKAWVLK